MRIAVDVDVAAVIERLGGPRAAARILGVALSTPYRWRHKGDMPASALFSLLSHLPVTELPAVLRVRAPEPAAPSVDTESEEDPDVGSGEWQDTAG